MFDIVVTRWSVIMGGRTMLDTDHRSLTHPGHVMRGHGMQSWDVICVGSNKLWWSVIRYSHCWDSFYQLSSVLSWLSTLITPALTSLDQQTWGFLRKSKWFEELDHFFWWLSLVKFVEELWDCLNECSVTDTDTTPIPGPGQYHSGDVEESCNTLLIITDSLKPAQHAATSSFTYFNIQIVSSLLHSLNDSLAFKFDQLRCSARTMQKNASFIIHCLIFSAMFYIHLMF